MRCPALCPNMSSALWRPHAHQSDAQNSGAMVASLLCGSWRFSSWGWRWRTGSSKMCATGDYKNEEPPYWKTNRLDRCKRTASFLAKRFLSNRSNILRWEADVCILLLELINHSSFHIQVERGKKKHFLTWGLLFLFTLSFTGRVQKKGKHCGVRRASWRLGQALKQNILIWEIPQEGLVWHHCF